jgi:hypothetical protein
MECGRKRGWERWGNWWKLGSDSHFRETIATSSLAARRKWESDPSFTQFPAAFPAIGGAGSVGRRSYSTANPAFASRSAVSNSGNPMTPE